MESSIFSSNILDYKKNEVSKFEKEKNELQKLFSYEEEFDEII